MNRIHRVRDAWFPRVLLVGPMPVSPVTGGVEKGIDMLLRTDLAKRTEMRLFNNYRRPDPRRRVSMPRRLIFWFSVESGIWNRSEASVWFQLVCSSMSRIIRRSTSSII